MSDFECLPIGTAARLTQLEAEVERLRDSCAAKADRIDKLGETVERLRAALSEIIRYAKGIHDTHLEELVRDFLKEGQR